MAKLATIHDGDSPSNSDPRQSKTWARVRSEEIAKDGFGSLQVQSRENVLPQKRKSPQSRAGFFAKLLSFFLLVIGRGERIRTSDPLLPKQMRYRTALRPEPTIVGD